MTLGATFVRYRLLTGLGDSAVDVSTYTNIGNYTPRESLKSPGSRSLSFAYSNHCHSVPGPACRLCQFLIFLLPLHHPSPLIVLYRGLAASCLLVELILSFQEQ